MYAYAAYKLNIRSATHNPLEHQPLRMWPLHRKLNKCFQRLQPFPRILFAYISPLKPRESFKTAENACINHLFKDYTRSYER
jgi:hypothetical protein